MAINISRIGHVALRVRDLERTKLFYTTVLGFKVVEQDPEHGTDAFMGLWNDYQNDGHTFDIVPVQDPQSATEPPGRNGVGVVHVALKVESNDDLMDAYRHLVEHGVEIDRMIEHVNQRSIYFNDPDGNRLEIYFEFPTSRELFKMGRVDRDFIFAIDDPLPPWAEAIPDDWDPIRVAEEYHSGTRPDMS